MYLVLGFERWDGIEVEPSLPMPFPRKVLTDEMPGIGFLPVFESREEAEKEYPDRQIIGIQETLEESEAENG